MSYTIGEVAKLLEISVETIRYYEKQNIIKPSRKANNKYRVYETWDVFFLMECLRYRQLGISVKDVSKMLHCESLSYFTQKVYEQEKVINHKITYYTMLEEKIEEYRNRLETLEYNVGNYWYKVIPEHLYLTDVSRNENDYGDIDKDDELFTKWMKHVPFVEYTQHILFQDFKNREHVNRDKWGLAIEKKYATKLNLTTNDSVQVFESQLCLCTIIDIGEKGQMNLGIFESVEKYLANSQFEMKGDIIGTLIARVKGNGTLHRYVEYVIPVKKRD